MSTNEWPSPWDYPMPRRRHLIYQTIIHGKSYLDVKEAVDSMVLSREDGWGDVLVDRAGQPVDLVEENKLLKDRISQLELRLNRARSRVTKLDDAAQDAPKASE